MKLAEVQTDENQPAPKILHFIWAGGRGRMRQKSLEVVIAWVKHNPDFMVYLWIDERTCGDIAKCRSYYKDRLVILADEPMEAVKKTEALLSTQEPLVVYEEDLPNESIFLPGKIILKDIEKNGLRNKWVAYFIDLIRPNYGASSDILRNKILYRYGGAYFDTDIQVGKTTLRELSIFTQPGGHRMLLDDFSQRQHLSVEMIESHFSLLTVGNDAIICTKANPLMLAITEFLEKRIEDMQNHDDRKYALCYGSQDIKFISIFMTGPKALQDCIDFYPCSSNLNTLRGGYNLTVDSNGKHFLRNPAGPVVEICPLRYSGVFPNQPLPPTHSWLKASKSEYSNLDELKIATLNTIMMEKLHFKIVRVDDHIEDLISCSAEFEEKDRFTEKSAFDFIRNAIRGDVLGISDFRINPKFLLKIIGMYEVSSQLLREAIPKDLDKITKMISCLAYWGEFSGFFTQEGRLDKTSKYLEKLRLYYVENPDNTLPSSLIAILGNINASVDVFMVYCERGLDYFDPSGKSAVEKQILDYCQRYLIFLNRVLQIVPNHVFRDGGFNENPAEQLMIKIARITKSFEPKGGPLLRSSEKSPNV